MATVRITDDCIQGIPSVVVLSGSNVVPHATVSSRQVGTGYFYRGQIVDVSLLGDQSVINALVAEGAIIQLTSDNPVPTFVVNNPQSQLLIGTIVGSDTTLVTAADGGSDGLSADGITWAQAPAIFEDAWGKLITCFQNNTTGKPSHWMWSNDGAVTWTTNQTQIDGGALTRASLACDTVSGTTLHALWDCTASTDGILYRRYTITRDGSHNITAISAARQVGINLQLDAETTGSMEYELPVLLWIPEGGSNGSLLAMWGARNSGGSGGSEIRASMRVLSLDTNDNTASNWKAPVTTSSTTIGNAPAVPYTAIQSNTSAVCGVGLGAARKSVGSHQNDIVVLYNDGATSQGGTVRYRRLRWNSGSNDWSTGLTTPVVLSAIDRAGTDTLGYSSKWQLISQPRWDKNGNLGAYLTTYKDNTNRDTATLILFDDAESTATLVDVYSAGSHQDHTDKFVTGDLSYDGTLDRWVVSYTDLPAKSAWVTAYTPSGVVDQAAQQIYSSRPIDIPTMVNGRIVQGSQARLVILTRTFNTAAASSDGVAPTYTPPYSGIQITMDWA